MKRVNATVKEYGSAPYPAEYLATRISDGALLMEIRKGKSQSRKWVKTKHVVLKESVTEKLIEKVHEL